jgi:pilus assembly protein CpaB
MLIVVGVMLAVVAAGLAVFALSSGKKTEASKTTNEPQDVTVVQAKSDITAHTLLEADDLEEVEVKADTVTDDTVRSASEVIGFAYDTDLLKGQRILRTNLEEQGLANEIADGKRAISVPVEKHNLLGGLLREDDHIDLIYDMRVSLTRVLPTEPIELPEDVELKDLAITLVPYGQEPGATYPYEGEPGSRFAISDPEEGDPLVKLILQDVRVVRIISSGAEAGGAVTESDYIVLEVDPQQAEVINFMMNHGSFQVALRNAEDVQQIATNGVNFQSLVMQFGFPIPSTVRLPGPGAQ